MSFSRTLIHAAGVVASGALAVSCGAVFAADGKDVNSAFVFIKPHANTLAAQALQEGSVYNALDACNVLGVDAMGLDKLWATAKKVRRA